ncbi:MAG: single-stranded DNA-binding protein [Caldilineaceae bacterium]
MYQMLTIVGRLGADPEMRYTSSGTPVCSFSVATDRVWNNEQGVRQEETTWHRVTTWRKQAETCAQYLTKGSMVMVTGTVKARGYSNRDGQISASLEVNADVVRFLSGNRTMSEAANSSESSDPGAGSGGDIPF